MDGYTDPIRVDARDLRPGDRVIASGPGLPVDPHLYGWDVDGWPRVEGGSVRFMGSNPDHPSIPVLISPDRTTFAGCEAVLPTWVVWARLKLDQPPVVNNYVAVDRPWEIKVVTSPGEVSADFDASTLFRRSRQTLVSRGVIGVASDLANLAAEERNGEPVAPGRDEMDGPEDPEASDRLHGLLAELEEADPTVQERRNVELPVRHGDEPCLVCSSVRALRRARDAVDLLDALLNGYVEECGSLEMDNAELRRRLEEVETADDEAAEPVAPEADPGVSLGWRSAIPPAGPYGAYFHGTPEPEAPGCDDEADKTEDPLVLLAERVASTEGGLATLGGQVAALSARFAHHASVTHLPRRRRWWRK